MSNDNERALLGAVILDNSAWERVSGVVRAEDFADYSHAKVWRTMAQLMDDGKPVDLLSLTDNCDVPGDRLAGLSSAVPTSANAGYYADAVHDAGTKRNAIRVLRETLEQAQKMVGASDIIEYVESRIFELHDKAGGQYRHISDYLKSTIDTIEERTIASRSGNTVGIASGLTELDHLTGGFRRQDLVIVGARASIGKTALGLTVAYNVSNTTPCAFFSLEMSGENLAERLLSMAGRIHYTKIRNGTLKDSDFHDLTNAATVVNDRRLWVYDVSNARLSDIRAKARRLVAREGVQVIVVDYIGLIKSDGSHDKRHEQIGHITRSLKALARELDVPVLAMAQINRSGEGKMPSLAELAESGNIEQDADCVIFLHRDRDSQAVKTECRIAKARNGPTGDFSLAFLGQYTMFRDFSDSDYGV